MHQVSAVSNPNSSRSKNVPLPNLSKDKLSPLNNGFHSTYLKEEVLSDSFTTNGLGLVKGRTSRFFKKRTAVTKAQEMNSCLKTKKIPLKSSTKDPNVMPLNNQKISYHFSQASLQVCNEKSPREILKSLQKRAVTTIKDFEASDTNQTKINRSNALSSLVKTSLNKSDAGENLVSPWIMLSEVKKDE